MICVTESNPVSRRLLRSANEAPELMTGTARRNVLSVCLRSRRVTTETRDMRIQARWDREPDAIAISAMTSRTRSRSMCGVIEPGVETTQRRKGFDLATLSVRVTNTANLTRRIRELLCVTTRTRRMRSLAGQGRLR